VCQYVCGSSFVCTCRNPPGFGFIVYKYAEDAERAVRDVHGGYVKYTSIARYSNYKTNALKDELMGTLEKLTEAVNCSTAIWNAHCLCYAACTDMQNYGTS